MENSIFGQINNIKVNSLNGNKTRKSSNKSIKVVKTKIKNEIIDILSYEIDWENKLKLKLDSLKKEELSALFTYKEGLENFFLTIYNLEKKAKEERQKRNDYINVKIEGVNLKDGRTDDKVAKFLIKKKLSEKKKKVICIQNVDKAIKILLDKAKQEDIQLDENFFKYKEDTDFNFFDNQPLILKAIQDDRDEIVSILKEYEKDQLPQLYEKQSVYSSSSYQIKLEENSIYHHYIFDSFDEKNKKFYFDNNCINYKYKEDDSLYKFNYLKVPFEFAVFKLLGLSNGERANMYKNKLYKLVEKMDLKIDKVFENKSILESDAIIARMLLPLTADKGHTIGDILLATVHNDGHMNLYKYLYFRLDNLIIDKTSSEVMTKYLDLLIKNIENKKALTNDCINVLNHLEKININIKNNKELKEKIKSINMLYEKQHLNANLEQPYQSDIEKKFRQFLNK